MLLGNFGLLKFYCCRFNPVALRRNRAKGLRKEIPYVLCRGAAEAAKEVITRLHADSLKLLQFEDVKERFHATGLVPFTNTPDEYERYIRSEIEKWAKVVKALNLRVD